MFFLMSRQGPNSVAWLVGFELLRLGQSGITQILMGAFVKRTGLEVPRVTQQGAQLPG